MSEITITRAKREEADKILYFVKELARYERMRKYVKASVEDIVKNIFDDERAEVIFVRRDGEPIGFAIYYYSFSTFLARPTLHLEDFFVEDKERGKGIGKKVLKYLARIALENDCLRFEWNCLEWNKPSIRFYENLGAKPLRGWIPFRMDGKDLEKFSKEE
ncbi:Acetyltransferase (GNAT) family protein [Candidatus Izimaplasma bacterium HR1]|jgi:GNAT superfamily N-acetyltransferase|uniref:GNAT family N-acetyltransferase n=1 Tax=Candidatus Izimoplasma sp. HR1 TaxID=1541959 RepID=UPI0004F83533|nr:Acetyltransferase (GNAT) family protein [Candidatus Izimaplasma bacterium HR1]